LNYLTVAIGFALDHWEPITGFLAVFGISLAPRSWTYKLGAVAGVALKKLLMRKAGEDRKVRVWSNIANTLHDLAKGFSDGLAKPVKTAPKSG